MARSNPEKMHRVTQTEVRRYVVSRLLPECNSEPLPFCERELARTLQVNRLTVRRAAARLLRDEILIQIDGRKGLFLNPSCRSRGQCEKYYGILCGELPVLSPEANQILRGFFAAARDDIYNIDCQFISPTAETPEWIVNEIMTYPLHALICFSPSPKTYPVLELLLERSLPLAVVNPVRDSRVVPFHTNTISIDYRGIGVKYAEKVLAGGYRKILFAGLDSDVFRSFREYLEAHSFPFPLRNFIGYSIEDHDPEKLAEIIRKRKIEMVVSDGRVFHDLDCLSHLVSFSNLHFLLSPLSYVRKTAVCRPDYHILFPDFLFDDLLEAVGNVIAGKVAKEVPSVRFQNETVLLPERKTKSSIDHKPIHKERKKTA